jgi:hypothetical protein
MVELSATLYKQFVEADWLATTIKKDLEVLRCRK